MTTTLNPVRTEVALPEIDLGTTSHYVPSDNSPPMWHRLTKRLYRDPSDSKWVRPALFVLLGVTALLYLWGLSAEGWANSFYAAAVQAGTKSWKAFFFGSFDASNFITVDKPPASLWVMEISARIFGFNSWSMLVPEALEGVAAVGVLYATVKRWLGAPAGLLAGAVMALTPVAALMFRFNNPDALLVLLLTSAAYFVTRAIEDGRTKWLVIAMSLVGTGFITKMMQAFLVIPAFGLVYLFAGPPKLGRRIIQLCYAAIALLVSAGWWVAIVTITPKADRPYVGGSTNDSILNLIFGYNGFGRVTGNEKGSTANQWGPTGWDRLFLPSFGSQISWLIPGALILMVATLWFTRRSPRTDRIRAAMLLWGGWLIVTGLLLSYAKGIIHPYYTVALSPAIGALVGIGAVMAWRHRSNWIGRAALSTALAATTIWAFVLLGRSSTWMPELRTLVLPVGLTAAAALLIVPLRHRIGIVVASIAIVAGLAGPTAYTLETVSVAHSGSIPSAGPTQSGATGFGGGGPGGARPGAGGFGGTGTGSTAGRGGLGGGFGSPPGSSTAPRTGTLPTTGSFPGAATGRGGIGGAGGAVGGLLDASTPSTALTKLLEADASHYSWVVAVVGSNSASGYQLATDDPVMAIGGFNGTDPAPSLAQFRTYVAEGKIHYFIAGGGTGGGPGGGTSSGTDVGSQITSWVEAHYTEKTVGGTTVYDLTSTK